METAREACRLHDARHAQRLAQWFARHSEKLVHRMPRACHGWAETVAASRVLDHPAMGAQEMLSGHQRATRERLRVQAVVLVGQDTTFLDDGTSPPTKGRGTVQRTGRAKSLRPPTVAFTPARMHLGGLGRKGWPRPEPPVAQERPRQPLEEQERDRGLAGDQLACEVQPSGPETLVVNVADPGRGDSRVVSGGHAAFPRGTGGGHYPSDVPAADRHRARAALRGGGHAAGPSGRRPHGRGAAAAPPAASAGHPQRGGQTGDVPWGSPSGRPAATR